MVKVKPIDRLLGIKLDTRYENLAMVFKDYQEVAMKYLWRLDGVGASSRDVHNAVIEDMERLEGDRPAISRASIINFLNAMVDEGVLNYTLITGKGGHRRIYSPKYDETGLKQWIAETVLGSLLRDFYDETRIAIQNLLTAEDP